MKWRSGGCISEKGPLTVSFSELTEPSQRAFISTSRLTYFIQTLFYLHSPFWCILRLSLYSCVCKAPCLRAFFTRQLISSRPLFFHFVLNKWQLWNIAGYSCSLKKKTEWMLNRQMLPLLLRDNVPRLKNLQPLPGLPEFNNVMKSFFS